MNHSEGSRRRRRGLVFGAVVAAAIALFGSVVTVGAGSDRADAATSSELLTAASRAALADKLATKVFAAGAAEAVVAADTPAAVQVGGNLAARRNVPLLVATSGATAASVTATVQTLKVTQVTTVSAESDFFTDAFGDELRAAGAEIIARVSGTDPFALSTSAATADPATPEIVVASSTDEMASAIATGYAGSRGLPLVLHQDTTSDAMQAYFAALPATVAVTVVGKPETAPTGSMTEEQIGTYFQQDTTDPQQASTWALAQSQAAGLNAARVVTAPVNAPDALALAAAYARSTGAIAAPAGKTGALTTSSRANEILGLWRSAASAVSLVGVSLTATDLTNIAKPTTTAPAASPAFRASNLVRTSAGGFTLTVTAVSGATRYRALNLEGTQVATSTTTTLSFKESVPSLLVVAEKGTTELSRFNFRVNGYDDDAMRESAVTGTVANGSVNLHFLGTTKTPRLITRIQTDPFNANTAPSAEKPVGLTCSATWTDVGLDKTKQYEYAVSDLSNVATKACDASAAGGAATSMALFSGRLSLPFTSVPTAKTARTLAAVPPTATAASPTQVDMVFMAAKGSSETAARSAVSAKAIGDDWADVLVRWQAYIPEKGIPVPGFTGDFTKPRFLIHGDGHGTNQPNGSARFTQTLRVGFGSDHYVRHDTPTMGLTSLDKCTLTLSSCSIIASERAPLSELKGSVGLSTNVFGAGYFRAAASMPLIKFSPPIDTDVGIFLGPGVSRIFGYHDRMPKHEAYFGVVQSEWYRVYSSPYVSYAQLPCLYSSPSKPAPYCGVKFNAQI